MICDFRNFDTPLCPAGHLPLAGEMGGSPEGGK